jgi:hypothetical protein
MYNRRCVLAISCVSIWKICSFSALTQPGNHACLLPTTSTTPVIPCLLAVHIRLRVVRGVVVYTAIEPFRLFTFHASCVIVSCPLIALDPWHPSAHYQKLDSLMISKHRGLIRQSECLRSKLYLSNTGNPICIIPRPLQLHIGCLAQHLLLTISSP